MDVCIRRVTKGVPGSQMKRGNHLRQTFYQTDL